MPLAPHHVDVDTRDDLSAHMSAVFSEILAAQRLEDGKYFGTTACLRGEYNIDLSFDPYFRVWIMKVTHTGAKSPLYTVGMSSNVLPPRALETGELTSYYRTTVLPWLPSA